MKNSKSKLTDWDKRVSEMQETLAIWRDQEVTRMTLNHFKRRSDRLVDMIFDKLLVAKNDEDFYIIKGLAGIVTGLNELLELDAETLLVEREE